VGRHTNGSEIKKYTTDIKVSFGSNMELESYVILKGRNGYSLRNIDQNLQYRMKRINEKNKAINFVRLFDSGKFFISDDEGSEWSLHENLSEELKNGNGAKEVALAKDGSWVV
jgi:hypothetical protein